MLYIIFGIVALFYGAIALGWLYWNKNLSVSKLRCKLAAAVCWLLMLIAVILIVYGAGHPGVRRANVVSNSGHFSHNNRG